jgi:hypothetical protein
MLKRGDKMRKSLIFLLGTVIIFAACSKSQKPEELKSYPLDSMEGVIDQTNIAFDRSVSFDGKGSLRIDAQNDITVPLFEVNGLTIDESIIFYQAKIRTEKIFGQVYIEMWCHFPGKGEFFSRSQNMLMSGTNDWRTQETPFILQKGEIPDYIKLNLVIVGHGIAWIDDIKLVKGPLPKQ